MEFFSYYYYQIAIFLWYILVCRKHIDFEEKLFLFLVLEKCKHILKQITSFMLYIKHQKKKKKEEKRTQNASLFCSKIKGNWIEILRQDIQYSVSTDIFTLHRKREKKDRKKRRRVRETLANQKFSIFKFALGQMQFSPIFESC